MIVAGIPAGVKPPYVGTKAFVEIGVQSLKLTLLGGAGKLRFTALGKR